jgi:hypothetical protein
MLRAGNASSTHPVPNAVDENRFMTSPTGEMRVQRCRFRGQKK